MSATRRGIDGKWEALTEERDELRAENAQLKTELDCVHVKLKRFEELPEDDMRKQLASLASERDELLRRLREIQDGNVAELLAPDESEREVLDAVLKAHRIIVEDWGLRANRAELASAVHVIQGFAQQHMLARLTGGRFGNWWRSAEEHHG